MKFEVIGKILGKGGSRRGGPGAHVAAFGKHPGWNDHVEDIGLDTEALVNLRRTLYVEGIGGNIDAGAWDGLDDRSRIEGFAHAFTSSVAGRFIVGRLWSSTDGVGRAKYPFVVAAEVAGLDAPEAIHCAMGSLLDAERACRTTNQQQPVIDAVRRCEEQLNARLARPASVDPSSTLQALLSHEALGPRHRGVQRIIYQLERDFGAYTPGGGDSGSGTRAKAVDLRPQHIRVPACFPDAAASLAAWSRFFAERLDPACAIMLFRRIDGHWIDAIVGHPGPAQIFCLRAGPIASPLASEVPYTIEPAFASRVAEWIRSHPAA